MIRRVRARALGLFFVCGLAASVAACAPRDAHALAARDDRADATGLYTWLVDHDPSALVAWGVPPERLRPLAPDARTIAAANDRPCAQASRLHAALVVVASDASVDGRLIRDAALDCGVALFRDAGGLAIAPR